MAGLWGGTAAVSVRAAHLGSVYMCGCGTVCMTVVCGAECGRGLCLWMPVHVAVTVSRLGVWMGLE